jgi:hypothetical protein
MPHLVERLQGGIMSKDKGRKAVRKPKQEKTKPSV